MRLKEVPEDRTLQVFYDGFKDVGLNRDFSHDRELEIESPSTGLAKITMSFNRLNFDGPVDMPYEVPARFKRSK